MTHWDLSEDIIYRDGYNVYGAEAASVEHLKRRDMALSMFKMYQTAMATSQGAIFSAAGASSTDAAAPGVAEKSAHRLKLWEDLLRGYDKTLCLSLIQHTKHTNQECPSLDCIFAFLHTITRM